MAAAAVSLSLRSARSGAAAAAAAVGAAGAVVDVRAAAARAYRGPVKAVIFDWAGTIVDYGSLAPVQAFVEVFKRHGITIDVATARGPMGKNKLDHITDIVTAPAVAAQWVRVHGAAATAADIARLYADFTPIQVEVVKTRADPIPGALDAIRALRARGIKIGSCSGYNDAIMAVVRAEAGRKGLTVDAVACANAAGSNGRPKPWLSTAVAEALDVYPLAACVKVDDTLPGIGEGINAGMWTVGVVTSGNEMGLDAHEVAALPPAELAARVAAATDRFVRAGAHYVVPDVSALPAVVDHIEAAMARGATPLAP